MANKQPAKTEMGRWLDKVCAQLGSEHSPYALKRLAEDVGVHISVLQRIRAGSSQPSLLTIWLLSQSLGYTFSYLVGLALTDAFKKNKRIRFGGDISEIIEQPIHLSPKGLILAQMYDKGSDAQKQLFDRIMSSIPIENSNG